MNRMMRAIRRGWQGRDGAERELDAEVGAYLEGLVEEKVARGMTGEAARREALMELGGREQVKEAVRDVRFGVWLENLVKDFSYGARLLVKSPGFTAVAVLTLALGMGPNIAIFSFVNGILLQPLPYAQPQRLVQLFHSNPKFTDGGDSLPVSPPTFVDWQTQSKTLESVAACATSTQVLTGGEPERVSSAGVHGPLFATLGVQPLLGKVFSPEVEKLGAEKQVIVSYGVWQRRLGGRSNVIGETLQVSSQPHTIVGVMPRGFSYPEGTDVWLPLAFDPGEMKERFSMYLEVIGRLRAGSSVAEAQAEIALITQQALRESPQGKDFGARVASLREETVREVRPSLMLLFAAGGLVVLIACVNVANLLLARGAARSRDLAVRAALGAGRGRLMQQLLSEALLIALAGGALALLGAGWSLASLRAVSPASLPRMDNVRMDAAVVLYSMLLAALTTILFGLLPVWRATRLNLSDSLKEGSRSNIGGTQGAFRYALVVAETCLSLILLVAAGLLLRTLWTTLSVNPGFDARNVLTADVYLPRAKYPDDAKRAAFSRAVLEKLKVVPGVEAASLTTQLPLSGARMSYGFLLEGETELSEGNRMPGTKGNPRAADLRFVSPDYFRVMRMPVLRGRGITEQDLAGAAESIVINEVMAEKYWPGQNPLGKRIRLARGDQPAWREIVGVVGSVRHASLRKPPAAEMYVSWDQQTVSFFRLAVRTAADPAQWAVAVRQAVWSVDKDQPVSRVRPMEGVVLSSVADTGFFGVLFGVFAGLALLLAAFGIYSVMAYSVTQRTREIGIRMALGARGGEVLRLFLREGLRVTLVGIVLGTAGALYASRWVEKLLYGVTRTDPVTFALVTAVLIITALAACLVPALRATRVDPLEALRHE